MTEIKKYIKHYVIHFKDSENFSPQEVSNEWGQAIMKQLNTQEFVMINGTYYNKYEIKVIKPFEVDYELEKEKQRLINEQEPRVKAELERRLARNKNTKNLSLLAIKNAIETIKEEI